VTTKQRTDTTSLSKEIKAAGIPISVTQAGIQ
jgi:hypothetical protein